MTLLSSRSGGRAAVFGGAAMLLLVAADAVAQPAPTPRPPGSGVPPVITTSDDDDEDGVVRTSGGQPGVLELGGDKKGFDPTKPDTPAEEDAKPGATEDDATKVEDVIEWKTNFEQGIKCRKIPLNAKIRLDFNEISLGDLTKFISCVTEQNFILTGGANKNATVSILSPKPVTAYEAYKAYLSALEANGLTIVPNGRFLEIIPSGESKANGGPIYGVGKAGPNTDQMVTRLLQLDHVQAEEILPVLEKFKTGSADITIYAPTNTIILTDTGSNIRRLLKLIKELDVPVGKERIWIRPIVNTTAADLVQLLTQILGNGTGGSGSATTPTARRSSRRVTNRPNTAKTPTQAASASSVVQGSDELANITVTKMIADERTNSVIFVATRTAYLQVDKVIRKLDVPIPGEGSYHVQQLENADAEEVAQTLSSLASGSASSRTSSRVGRTNTATPAAGAAAPATGAAGLFEGEVKITAYKPTNSLLIESSLKDYLQIQKILRELDVRRKQVYVEAIVMEISTNKDKSINLNASGGTLLDVSGEELPLLFASGGLGLDINGALSTLNSGGGAIGLQGPIEQVSTGSDSGAGSFSLALFGFTLRALQTTSEVNVLSTPHVLTLENEDAEITIGKRQPYVTTSTGLGGLGGLSSLSSLAGGLTGSTGLSSLTSGLSGLSGLGGLGRNFQYVDVDLTLKIKPQVNASGYVRLEIDQSIDDIEGFVGGTASDGGAPITSKRKVNNVVVVRDGQPVVIGGLMRDKETESVSKIPFLGDIPLLGLLFRRTSTQVEKSNLLMIIVPHVISDPSDLKRIYEQRREEYRELGRMMAERKKEFEGELDYRKKAGVLHDIHAVIQKAKAERELRERAVFEGSEVDRVGPPETHDIEYDPRDAFKKAPEGEK